MVEAFREMVESRLNPDGSVKELVSIIITGPSTNVAAFKQKYPELYDSGVIDRAVVMGGAFDIPQWTPYAGQSVFDLLAEFKLIVAYRIQHCDGPRCACRAPEIPQGPGRAGTIEPDTSSDL